MFASFVHNRKITGLFAMTKSDTGRPILGAKTSKDIIAWFEERKAYKRSEKRDMFHSDAVVYAVEDESIEKGAVIELSFLDGTVAGKYRVEEHRNLDGFSAGIERMELELKEFK